MQNQEKGKSIIKTAKEFKLAPKTLRKAEKIKKYAERDPEIKEKWEKAKKGEISLEKVYKTVKKKQEALITTSIVNRFTEVGEKLQEITPQEKDNSKCLHCKKATVIAIPCEVCNHHTSKVICDDDLINRSARLRNPHVEQCKNALN